MHARPFLSVAVRFTSGRIEEFGPVEAARLEMPAQLDFFRLDRFVRRCAGGIPFGSSDGRLP